MAMKLYQHRELYGPLPASAFHRQAFKMLVLKHVPHVFPEFHVVYGIAMPSKSGDNVQPDFILIDKGYQAWWLAHVAVIAQRFLDSVYPEMVALQDATVTTELAQSLAAKNTALDLSSVDHLVHNEPPKLFLLANAFKKEWKTSLRKLGAILGIAEVFRSRNLKLRRSPRDEILRINGEQPEPPSQMVSSCETPALNLVRVMTPTVLGPHTERVLILFRGEVTQWTRVDTKSGVMLQPDGGFGLPDAKDGYEIRRRGDGNLEIRARARKAL